MATTYYQDLDIPAFADIKTIKAAYRKLAMLWHPDRNPDPLAQSRFLEIQMAYDFLKDAERRRDYDDELRQRDQDKTPPKVKTSFDGNSQWNDTLRPRAQEYADMQYDVFLKILSKEIKLHASYIPNIIAMAITGLFASMPIWIGLDVFLELGIGGLIYILVFSGFFVWLTYRLFKVMTSDYKIDKQQQ